MSSGSIGVMQSSSETVLHKVKPCLKHLSNVHDFLSKKAQLSCRIKIIARTSQRERFILQNCVLDGGEGGF